MPMFAIVPPKVKGGNCDRGIETYSDGTCTEETATSNPKDSLSLDF